MDQQEMADLLEIQQLAARYMAFSALKEQNRWTEIFTPDGSYNAFGTLYGLDDFPMLLNSAPRGQYIGNPPVVEFDGDTATGIQHYVFIDQSTHEMRLGWYNDEFARTSEGWRIRRRSTTFMRRTFDAGNAHDPSRYVAGTEID
jgi:SnoaL-like domain